MENFGSWSVLTTSFLIILYLALNGVTLSALLHLANGKWRFEIRRIACSMAVLFPVAFVLLIVILANGEHTFPWLAEAQEAAGHGGGSEHHLPGWLNLNFLVAREVIGFFIIAGLYTLFIKYQHESEIDSSYPAQRRFRNIALLIPFFYVLYGTMVAWDFEMTLVPSWHSASYGFYHFQSNFHMFLGFFVCMLYFLNRNGALKKEVPSYIFNYFAQFMLAMTILWTYLYFTQYLIMWYGRLPTDMDRYNAMMLEGLGHIWWTFLALKFVIPFTTLAITPNRHNPPVIAFIGAMIFLGTWLERYTWISGSVDSQYYHIPMTAFADIAITIVVVFAAFFTLKWGFTRYGILKQSAA